MKTLETLKDRLLGQIKTTQLCRSKVENCIHGQKKYWKDELLKSESITVGLRIAIVICEKEEKKAA